MTRWLLSLACLLPLLPHTAPAQDTAAHDDGSDLQFVVYLSRHGVRSPTGKSAQYNSYSSAPWPEWKVAPGYLTPHGFHLMELFGSFDRMQLASEGLFAAQGCDAASHTTIYADSDQRTRETGKALAQGLFPGCDLAVQGSPEATNNPIFHPIPSGRLHLDSARAQAAIAGRIGGDPTNLAIAYKTQIAALDTILATCGTASPSIHKRTSLFDIPATLTTGAGDHLADLKGPINTASTLSENLLLEYTEGMDSSDVGWGCVDRTRLQSLMDLHSAASDFAQRTPVIASAQASNLLDHIANAIEQAATHKAISGTLSKLGDKALFLVGHDTNIENVAGLLNLTWIADGRRDDTPPGSVLLFELWRQRQTGTLSVRTYFMAQTLDQMRSSTPLTLTAPPQRVEVFVPGCGHADLACPVSDFVTTLHQVIAPNSVIR